MAGAGKKRAKQARQDGAGGSSSNQQAQSTSGGVASFDGPSDSRSDETQRGRALSNAPAGSSSGTRVGSRPPTAGVQPMLRDPARQPQINRNVDLPAGAFSLFGEVSLLSKFVFCFEETIVRAPARLSLSSRVHLFTSLICFKRGQTVLHPSIDVAVFIDSSHPSTIHAGNHALVQWAFKMLSALLRMFPLTPPTLPLRSWTLFARPIRSTLAFASSISSSNGRLSTSPFLRAVYSTYSTLATSLLFPFIYLNFLFSFPILFALFIPDQYGRESARA